MEQLYVPVAVHDAVDACSPCASHEQQEHIESARHALDMGDRDVIEPNMDWWPRDRLDGRPLPEGFSYASNTNTEWLDVARLREIVAGI